AEFWVIPDRTKDRRDSFRALEIKILPPGTIATEEETHQCVKGTVERAPTLPQRQGFGGGREGGGAGGGMQPGVARFIIPPSPPGPTLEGAEDREGGGGGGGGGGGREEVEESGGGEVATSIVAALNHKELGKSQVPTLELGDVIEADLWKSKVGGTTTQAKNVRLVSFGGERSEGVVRSLREGGFGFIRPLGGNEDVYFRIADTCKNLPDLREGSEVVFTVKEGGDRRGDKKKAATRVEVQPKGTLKVEVTLAVGVSGVVTRDTKGSAQGMITVTDGSSLDMPFHLRFPKIAARLQEFVAQNMEKELVFSSELSSGERSAAHSLAGAEGLGHESLGEDSNRTIRVWKAESEEEAAAMKEEEKKRLEEHLQTVKDRSKNGERSMSVPYSREDTASTKPQQKPQGTDEAATTDSKDSKGKGKDGQEGAAGEGEADKDKGGPKRTGKSKLTQDFRTERGYAASAAAAAAAAQRGDLVTFDVMLNKG
ncbi:unnamed protein product, partial [Laminaria digitata]